MVFIEKSSFNLPSYFLYSKIYFLRNSKNASTEATRVPVKTKIIGIEISFGKTDCYYLKVNCIGSPFLSSLM